MNNSDSQFSISRFILSFVIFIYIISYTLVTLKIVYMASVNDFSFINVNEGINASSSFEQIKLAIFTIFGAVLGGATLGITSLHRYSAITKNLDIDHIWGYLMAPILSIIIGILIFCLLRSGLLVLTGDQTFGSPNINISIGYLSLGAICSYNWDVFILKLQKLSNKIND